MWENNHLHNRKGKICPSIATNASHHAVTKWLKPITFVSKSQTIHNLESIGMPVCLGDSIETQWWPKMIKLYYLTKNWCMRAYPSLARKCSAKEKWMWVCLLNDSREASLGNHDKIIKNRPLARHAYRNWGWSCESMKIYKSQPRQNML